MLSESLVVDVDSVRLWQLGRALAIVVLLCRSAVGVFFGPRYCKQKNEVEEDENARRVEDCASSNRLESM